MISDKRPTEKRIFVSYSHVDIDRWRKLKTHLIPLECAGQVSVWNDEKLQPGDELEKCFEEKISECDVFLALLSANFIASNPCRKECDEALARVQKGEQLTIISVLLRECAWEKAGLKKFKMIDDDGRPLIKTDADLDRAGTLLCRQLDACFQPEAPRPPPHQNARPEVPLRDFAWALLGLQKGAPGAVKRYIDLTLTNLEGEQQTWGKALEDPEHRSHLVYADSGCGKTTLLKHVAFELLEGGKGSDGLIPLYIHLGNLVDATLEKVLQTKLLAHEPYTAEWLLGCLHRSQIEKKVIYLFDGYDQVDGNKALKNVDTGHCIKMVTTRKIPDATLAAWANNGYKAWKLDPVSPRQVDDYIGTGAKAAAEWLHRLREERLTREMLRIPLFLEMLSRIVPEGRVSNNKLTAAWIIERYWDWQVNQENQARSEVSDLHKLNDEQWAGIHDCASDCAWRLALADYIETFTGPFADRIAHAVKALREAIQKAGLRNFDFVSIHAQGGHFRHQALQAYLAARAIAVELRTDEGGPTPIRDAILDTLASRFPERLIPGLETGPQLTFWLEAFGLVPGTLRELYRIRDDKVMEDDWDRAVWIIARDLIGRGLFLLAWRMVMRAKEEIDTFSSGDGWREILWQLVRYRRDSEDHFPKESERWHYDPLAQAIIALDGLVARGEDRPLREGLKHAFHELKGLFTQKLGAYELMVCYLHWSGSPGDLDDYRVAFLLGEADGCTKLLEAQEHFLIDGKSGRLSARTGAAWPQRGAATAFPAPDPAKFGEWLEGHFTTSGSPKNIVNSLEGFADNYFAPDSNPSDEAFSRWLGKRYIADLLGGVPLSLDVSLRIFDANWTWGVNEAVKARSDEVATAVLKRLASPKPDNKIAATVALGGLAETFKNQQSKLDEFKEPAWELFQAAVKLDDVELAYTGYHEAARFVTDSEKVRLIQAHIKRYYAHEIRWHDPYNHHDQITFERRRMGSDSPYPRKSWFYCFDAPLLLELGTNKDDDNIDRLLDDYESSAMAPYEREALAWARSAVACMRKL